MEMRGLSEILVERSEGSVRAAGSSVRVARARDDDDDKRKTIEDDRDETTIDEGLYRDETTVFRSVDLNMRRRG